MRNGPKVIRLTKAFSILATFLAPKEFEDTQAHPESAWKITWRNAYDEHGKMRKAYLPGRRTFVKLSSMQKAGKKRPKERGENRQKELVITLLAKGSGITGLSLGIAKLGGV